MYMWNVKAFYLFPVVTVCFESLLQVPRLYIICFLLFVFKVPLEASQINVMINILSHAICDPDIVIKILIHVKHFKC